MWLGSNEMKPTKNGGTDAKPCPLETILSPIRH